MRVRDREPIYRGVQSACLLLLIGLVSCRTAPLPRDGGANAELRVRQLKAVVERDGLGTALDSLQSAAAADSSVLRNAHQLAHDIGRAALERAGSPSVIVHCRPVFSSGCYHGVVEAYVQRRGDADMTELERMCAEAGGPDTPGPVSECVHGLGHGVLGVALDLDHALRLCDALSSADRRGACHSGAFMEAVIAALHDQTPHQEGAPDHGAHEHHAGGSRRLAIDASDPFSPCARFGDPYAKACWVYQGFLILRTAGFDARGALERCNQAPARRVAQCAQSIGFQITGLFQRDDHWVISQCGRAAALSSDCAAGAAAALSSMDWSGGRAARFCAAAPPGWRRACVASAGRTLRHLATPGDLQRFWQGAVAGRAPVTR